MRVLGVATIELPASFRGGDVRTNDDAVHAASVSHVEPLSSGPARRRSLWPAALTLFTLACADITPIANQREYGPVTALLDLFTSCQLLRTTDGPVLIDACWRTEELRARLKEAGFQPEDVKRVLLTHAHQDHVGGLSLLTQARVAALADERPVLAQHTKPARTIDDVLTDGQRLMLGGVEVVVYAVPGHTAGSAAFLVGGQTLVLGDNALLTGKGELGPVPRDRSAEPDRAVRSLVALIDRLEREGQRPRWLAPAHSGGAPNVGVLERYANANR